VRVRLVGTPNLKTIFEKFGYEAADKRPLRLTTHQFRHYLNTLAQMGGLSQLDIAKWSGRAKVAQNAAYDHQSDRDVLAMVRAAIGDENKMFGPLAHTPKHTLITRDQFAALKVLTAHTTDFGYCIHDFSMLPCQIHRDCLNCDEHLCVKGDEVRGRAIRLHRSETTALLASARKALGEDEFGANRWVEHQSLTLQRLDQLCAILDDPAVPDGAIIQPAGVISASRLDRARQQREYSRLKIAASPDSTENQP
ncbi:MAG: integrase, partial [Candidatus Binatia bacterium]